MDAQPHILIIDDDPQNTTTIVEFLEEENYHINIADSADVAWELLTREPDKYDVILLDKVVAEIGGFDLLTKIKQHPELHCTVILQSDNSEQTSNLNVGAQYYLSKPYNKETMLSVVRTAERHQVSYKHRVKNKISLGLLKKAKFEFKTIHEAHALASLLSELYPEPTKVITGLTELMINAVEHGNLAIDYSEKTELTTQGTLNKEIQRRLELPEFKDRYVTVHFQLSQAMIEIMIEDQGDGFDWEMYMEFDPNRLMDPHGRGIAIANKLSFCDVDYSGGEGNKVVARLYLT